MVYYLGRDVKVYLTTESTESQVSVVSNAVSALGGGSGSVSVAATGTVTITDLTEINNGDKVNLVASDGTSHDFTAGEVAGGGTWIAETSNIASATNLSAAINANANFSTTRASAVITVAQVEKGTAGNTTITLTDTFAAGMTKADFSGGTDGEVYAATIFAENLDDSTPDLTKIPDLTGVDIGISVTDEDVTYMGGKTVLKAEIKKETTVSLTRKKKDNLWDVVYNGPTASNEGWDGTEANKAGETGNYGARWGVVESDTDSWKINNGLMAPKDAVDYGTVVPCFGYRVHVELKNGEEVFSIPACQLTGHSISLNADGTTEETCELISHVTPLIGTAVNYDRLTAADM